MSINLTNLILEQLGGPMMRQIGGILGENEKATAAAAGHAVPAILGGFLKQASTDDGANALASMVDNFDDGILDNLTGLMSGGNHKGLLDQGSGILSSLFGGGLGSIVDAVSKSGGLGQTSTRSLLGLVAPIAMGVLGRQKKSAGLDAAGLAGLVMDQKSSLTDLLPSGIANVLGIGNILGDVAGTAKATASAAGDATARATSSAGEAVGSAARTVEAAGSRGSSMVTRLLPLLIILALGYFGYKKFMGGDAATPDVGIEAPDVSGMVDKATDAAAEMAGGAIGDVAGDLQGALNSGADALRGITDVESAKAAVPKLQEMSGALGGIVNKLDALPGPVKETVQKMAGDFMPQFQSLASNAMRIPGARPVLEQHVRPLLTQLESISG